MAVELAPVFLTPHSLAKSRTGGILARLLTRSGCELVAARMFAPSPELVADSGTLIEQDTGESDCETRTLLRTYVTEQFRPDTLTGRRRRVLMLAFRGDDAARRIQSVVGEAAPRFPSGDTIRGTYGDCVRNDSGAVTYFEPAVICSKLPAGARSLLELWTRFSAQDGGLLTEVVPYPAEAVPQRTLVLVKPDNFRASAGRPGNVLDFFSKTGLFIVGIRLIHLSTAQALEFYGPVRDALRTRLNGFVGAEIRKALSSHPELNFPIPPTVETQLGQILGPLYGEHRFDNLVRFMSGRSGRECPAAELDRPGTEPCLAVVYEGPDAVSKCRDVLGPTDPAQAPRGTIRREFGASILVNAAHASDSVESARREIAIVRPDEDDLVRELGSLPALQPS